VNLYVYLYALCPTLGIRTAFTSDLNGFRRVHIRGNNSKTFWSSSVTETGVHGTGFSSFRYATILASTDSIVCQRVIIVGTDVLMDWHIIHLQQADASYVYDMFIENSKIRPILLNRFTRVSEEIIDFTALA